MAEKTVRIEGSVPISGTVATTIQDSLGHQLNVRADGSLNTVVGVPEGAKFYVATLTDAPGVVAANNFLSVFNPIGSGKTLIFFSSLTIPYAGGATTTTSSMTVKRTTAASAGTLVAASTIGRFNTADGNPVAEVRTGNPTVTIVGISLLSTAPTITSAGAGASASPVSSTAPGASFICVPGEGIVWSTASGDVDQLWNVQVVWCEF